MNQNELFPTGGYQVRKPWYVSYALPGFSHGRPYWSTRIEACNSRAKYVGTEGAALLFWDEECSAKQLFEKIQRVPAVAGLFQNRFWVTFYGNGHAAFVDSTPLLPAPYAQATSHVRPSYYGLRNGARTFFWSPRELGMQCNRIEQFSNCAFCRHASNLGECLEVNAVRWARKNGFLASDVRIPPENSKDSTLYESDSLDALLRVACRDTNLNFVSPGIIAGPFSTKLLYVNEIDLGSVKSNIEDYKNRGIDAHNTRLAVERCKEECFFYSSCGMCTKPYYGHPRKCQEGEAHNRTDTPGPFSEYEVMEAARREVESWDSRSREEVAYIARAAGVTTKVLGQELVLRKMDMRLQNVEFIHERSGEVRTYSYEDAMEIIRSKYYSEGHYQRIALYPENTPPMSDDDYLIYAELCQVTDVSTGGWGCRQPITYVEWDHGYMSGFEIGVRGHHRLEARTLKRAAEIGNNWAELCTICTADKLRAVRAEADPETTKDKLP